MTGFLEALKVCLSRSVTFSGRASRAEFWWFTLAATVVYAGVTQLKWYVRPLELTWGVLMLILVAIAIPWVAAGFRRLHDTGLPGWLVLIPPLMSVLWTPAYYAMWFIMGDAAPPTSKVWYAVASMLAFIVVYFNWIIFPLWAILAYLLSRPTQPKTNRHGPPLARRADPTSSVS